MKKRKLKRQEKQNTSMYTKKNRKMKATFKKLPTA